MFDKKSPPFLIRRELRRALRQLMSEITGSLIYPNPSKNSENKKKKRVANILRLLRSFSLK